MPSRTEIAKQARTPYRLKPGEFPPARSEHEVGGELVEVDYIHRSGVFRREDTGELADFTLPPFGAVFYRNAEADLRDLPLGISLRFSLYSDQKGALTQAVVIQDSCTPASRKGVRYRLESVRNGKLIVSKQGAGKSDPEELLIDGRTQIWKGNGQIKPGELAVGGQVLFNYTGGAHGKPRRCIELWVGEEAQRRAAEQQRKRHFALLKAYGLPAWIDSAEEDRLTITLFSGDPVALQDWFQTENIDPAKWAQEHRKISVGVANEHLRTYLPNVTNKWATIEAFQNLPTEGYGCGGVRWTLRPEVMLEGFRKGHIVRLFAPGWPIEAMPFGEGLYAGGHDEEPADSRVLLSADFPYRTDFGNEDLPWYQLRPGKSPPEHSEHRVGGELVKVNPDGRSGQFRTDITGDLREFTLPPVGKALHLNAVSALADLPLGTHCLFFLYQDAKGAFTLACLVEDDYSELAFNTLTYRLEAASLQEGVLVVARHAAPVKVDYVLEPRVPSDSGRIELEVDAHTRVWKGDRQIQLSDLKPGDELLVNLAARTVTRRYHCTDIWVGTAAQRSRTAAAPVAH